VNINKCGWLHLFLSDLPLIRFPFNKDNLPDSGIYFFYEKSEISSGHNFQPRIVRIGTANKGNFKSRITEHFLLDETKMNFNDHNSKPSDRSIFRKNIGRTILNRNQDAYISVWNIDFTKKNNRYNYWQLRNIETEKEIEGQVSEIFRSNFSFKFLLFENNQFELEEKLIGTVSNCKLCCRSEMWFGNNSPDRRIRDSGLWQVQHLLANDIDDEQISLLENSKNRTMNFLRM